MHRMCRQSDGMLSDSNCPSRRELAWVPAVMNEEPHPAAAAAATSPCASSPPPGGIRPTSFSSSSAHRCCQCALLLLLLCLVLPLSPRPASCQSLQWGRTASCPDFRAYTQLHWEMALGHVPVKWLVTEDDDGLADRLVNAVSAFLVALITKRALCIVPAHTFGAQPPMELAYDAPFIDWVCRQHNSSSHMGYPWDWEVLTESGTDTVSTWGDLKETTSTYYKNLILSDLTQRPENNSSVWRLWMQRGLSIGLFHNLHHSQQLVDLGLRPATAFGCIASYLFRPNRQTLWLVPKPILSAMTNRNILKIGIQIRCGDANIRKQLQHSHNLTGHEEMSDLEFDLIAKPFFDCAATLEQDLVAHTGAAAVKWYLMTDTLALRNKAAAKFGPKLLSFTNTSIEFYQTATGDGFRRTVMEHWLLQQAGYHIITESSGLGRTAAFASLRENNVYTMALENRHLSQSITSKRVDGSGCSLKDYDGLYHLYDKWSGI